MKTTKSTKERLENDIKYFIGDDSDLALDIEELIELHHERNRNHMVLILGTDRFIWNQIDAVYKERENEYYKEYLNSFYKDTKIKSAYSIKSRNYINKVAGIDLWCRKNNTDEPILKLIQKGYNPLYRQFKVGIKKLNLDVYIAKHIKKGKKQLSDLDIILSREFEMYKTVIIAMFLSSKFNVDLTGELWQGLMEGYINDVFKAVQSEDLAGELLQKINDEVFNDVTLEMFDISFKDFRKCKNILDVYNITRSSQIISSYQELRKLNIINEDLINDMDFDELNDYVHYTLMSIAENSPTENIVKFISNLFTTIGVDDDILKSIEVDINLIKIAIMASLGEENINSIAEKNEFAVDDTNVREFLYLLTNLALLKNYKNLTPDLFDINKEEVFYKLESLKSELEDFKQKYSFEIDKKNEIIKNQIKKREGLVKDLEQAQKEIKRLKKELAKTETDKEELIALREYAYENENNGNILQDEIAISSEDEFREKLDFINSKNIIIFGGHPNWVKKLKELLPEQKYIDVNASSSARLNFLENTDLIVISPKFMSHGLFYKIKEALSNRKAVKMIFVDDVNTTFIINKIYKNLA